MRVNLMDAVKVVSRYLLLALPAVAGLGLMHCAAAKPAERGRLAQPCMESPFAGSRSLRSYEDKVFQTMTGSHLPTSAPGGGCGCVN